MLKNIILGAAALTLLATVAVVAQQRSGNRDFMHRLVAEDRAALVDARVAELHTGLHLSADQEKLWSGFELAYRDLATIRSEGSRNDRRREAASDPIERAQHASEALAARSAALKRYVDSAAPLYQTLDDGQKQRFAMLSRVNQFQGRRNDRDRSERG
jgi:hypothetical protein